MDKLDRNKFLFLYEQAEFGTLTEPSQSGLCSLLDFLEADVNITDPRHAAYMLATALHETAKTYRPIAEYGKGSGRKYGTPAANGKVFYGRGYVQLTWAENYQAMGQALGVDLYCNPDLAMQPDVSYQIMSRGMRKGSFTGVSLSRFIAGEKCDFKGARKIINGTDCDERIAGYAVKILEALEGAKGAA
ncbi:MAG TPA: glycoside hydrolase family 19 protein [Geomonas sp.]